MRLVARVTLLLALGCAACGPTVDLTTGLEIEVNDTGWFDAGIVQGQNKLVPAARVTVKNLSDQPLVQLQLNAQFKRVTDPEEWGYAFMTAAGSNGLAPGATAGPFLLKSEHGYTGSDQSRQDMLKNTQFVDAKVLIFAKYGSIQWVRKGEHQIKRQLIEK
jgi:hypothetical protein